MDAETRANAIKMHEAHIRRAVQDQDHEAINLMARCLVMADEAKQVLRDKGYGWTGLDLLETAQQVEPVPRTWEEEHERQLRSMSPVARRLVRRAYE